MPPWCGAQFKKKKHSGNCLQLHFTWLWGIAPRILYLGTRWRWVVSLMPLPFYPGERDPGNHWRGGWVGPTAGLDAVAKTNDTWPCRELSPCRPARSLVTTLTELSRSIYHIRTKWKWWGARRKIKGRTSCQAVCQQETDLKARMLKNASVLVSEFASVYRFCL